MNDIETFSYHAALPQAGDRWRPTLAFCVSWFEVSKPTPVDWIRFTPDLSYTTTVGSVTEFFLFVRIMAFEPSIG